MKNKNTKLVASLLLAGTILSVKESANADDINYVVEPGDTLGKICTENYGYADCWEEVARRNGIDGNLIFPGDVIVLPDEVMLNGQTYEKYPEDGTYVIQPGDTMSCITSVNYDETLDTLKRLSKYNNILNPDVINAGDVIKLPVKEKLGKVDISDYEYPVKYEPIFICDKFPPCGKFIHEHHKDEHIIITPDKPECKVTEKHPHEKVKIYVPKKCD